MRFCLQLLLERGATTPSFLNTVKYTKVKIAWNKHVAEDGRLAEITVGLVLRARAEVAQEKVSGPEHSMFAEMIKELPQEINYEVTRCSQARFMEQEGALTLEEQWN